MPVSLQIMTLGDLRALVKTLEDKPDDFGVHIDVGDAQLRELAARLEEEARAAASSPPAAVREDTARTLLEQARNIARDASVAFDVDAICDCDHPRPIQESPFFRRCSQCGSVRIFQREWERPALLERLRKDRRA